MGVLDMFSKKPPASQSYRIATDSEDRVIKRISSNDDTLDTTILAAIVDSTSQSVNSLSSRLRVNRERIQRSLLRLRQAGLISPVQQQGKY